MTDSLSSIPAYVYKIIHKDSGQYYFGFRAAHSLQNRQPEQDLWVKYFTSSKLIAQMIKEYGTQSFDAIILTRYQNPDDAYWAEQTLIEQHLADPKCLNKWYRRREDNRKVFHNLGVKITRTEKDLASYRAAGIKKRGKKLPPRSEEYKKAQSLRGMGRKHKPETILKLKLLKTGLTKTPEAIAKQAAKLRGRPQSEEHKAKRLESMRRTLRDPTRPWLCCPVCNYKTQNKSIYTAWHGDNCKPKPPRPKKGETTYTCTVCGFRSTNATNISRWHNSNCRSQRLCEGL